MKIFDIFFKQIDEGVSDVLYHITSFSKARKIVETNTMTSKGGEISFSRSLTGTYPVYNKLIGVIFEVDGRKLSHRYKGKPVGTEDFDLDDWDKIHYHGRENGQMEDRVMTHRIDNFLQYVTKIIVYLPADDYDLTGSDGFGDSYADQLDHAFSLAEDILPLLRRMGKPIYTVGSIRGLFNKREWVPYQ